MSYAVRFTRTVADKVANFHPDIKKSLRAAIKEISREPYAGKELQEELFGFLSYRFRRYRVIYQVNEEGKEVLIYTIGHRRDVYELFSELIDSKK
ncbi:MAG: type II toxin-antitoxin system RelE/ParE family toxin [Proteobacteria bacterium]|nr:type II toxin-antitoxin system RelE/ParE family toxin [Pseudomonadota bacterium]MBU1714840.1 type II toxin-antitoxin system RelE/ParE family toxin [Pseudomonadota bacterium]